jgi:ATP-dependent DNA helicase RecG
MDLSDLPVTRLRGVGPKQAEKFARLQITTIQDVLFHLPLRYQDRTRVFAIGDLVPGSEAVCSGVIMSSEVVFRRRRSLICRIADGSGTLCLRFFHFNKQQQDALREGVRIRCFGEIRRGPQSLEIVHPEYQQVLEGVPAAVEETLTPIYPVTDGLHQLSMRKVTSAALEYLQKAQLTELLPASHGYEVSLQQALMLVHRPPPDVRVDELLQGTHPCVQRLALEELVAHRLSVQRAREHARLQSAPVMRGNNVLRDKLVSSLPFALTDAQRRVIEEIEADLAKGEPMLRLVQGDVGSGKTLVAAAAAAMAVDSGYQVAVMAPTEILAEQHLLGFAELFEPLGLKIGWLKGKLGAKQKRDALESIALGHSHIAVGTHALFQKDVSFARLGLTIVDEQHRFGVDQRLSLREKGLADGMVPHQLTMTATPIPRTLAMTAYADLDCSVIDELPPGRQAITTVAIPATRRREVIERVAGAIAQGRQVYWVCTLVEESEVLQVRAAEETLNELAELLTDCNISLVHGRMSGAEKDEAMTAFKNNDTQLLVATTVIEVGVDVPNASLIIIENAERLGLSQLHQLRGRVGRGQVPSSCVLMYEAGLSNRSRDRIAIMRESTDGFVIAERDLQLRGAGELLGTRQTGSMQFRIADLMRDKHLLDSAKKLSEHIQELHADRIGPLVSRWMGENAPDYGNV